MFKRIMTVAFVTFLVITFSLPNIVFAQAGYYPILTNVVLSNGNLVESTEGSIETFDYAIVDNNISSITVTPTAVDATRIYINSVAVTNGTESGAIQLNEGSNIIKVIVQQSSNSVTYTFNIFRHYPAYTPGVFEIINIPYGLSMYINYSLNRGWSPGPLTNTELLNITTLEISNENYHRVKLETLDGLQYLANLKTLSIKYCNDLTNAEALSAIDSLREFNMVNCQLGNTVIDDILSRLSQKQLTKLKINNLANFNNGYLTQAQQQSISSMSNMQELTLQYDQIRDISFVFPLKDLKKLDLGSNALTQISGLQSLTNLNNVNLYGNYMNLKTGYGNIEAINALLAHSTVNSSFQNQVSIKLNETDKINSSQIISYNNAYYGDTYTFFACQPKQGYIFNGWDMDGDGISDYHAGESVVATPQYDFTTKNYGMSFTAIYDNASDNAYINNVSLSQGKWDVAFNKYTYEYHIRIDKQYDTATLACEPDDARATYTLYDIRNNVLSNQIQLAPGMNLVNIIATSYSGSLTKTYQLYIQRDAEFDGGDGTAENPFQISTPEQLNEVRNNADKCFELMADIDMRAATSAGGSYYYNGKGWEPIDNFSGSIDGKGHRILHLHIERIRWDDMAVGLFSTIKNGGKVSNLGMVDSDIYGGDKVGGISGINEGTIEGCYNTGYIRGYGIITTLGGITGSMEYHGLVSRCYNIGRIETIPTMASGNGEVGGIVGQAYYNGGGTIRDCYNAGELIGRGYAVTGGIIAWGGPFITNCYNVGSIYSDDATGEVFGDCDTAPMQNSGLYFLKRNEYIVGAKDANGNEFASGKTFEEMQAQSSFTSFDFDNTWTMTGETSYPYPQLKGVEQISIPENAREYSGGNGLPNDPFQITSSLQLNNVRNHPGASFILMNDIDLTNDVKAGGPFYNSGLGFQPIGNDSNPFRGSFEGNGKEIKGLTINRPDTDCSGLFGICHNANIYNIRVSDVNILARSSGGICGYSEYSSISGCSVSGTLGSNKTFADIGGIIGGGYYGSVKDCFNSTNIFCTDQCSNLGGIAGSNGTRHVISRCFNTGDIHATGNDTLTGGLTAANAGEIHDSYNTGFIFNGSNSKAGGLVSSNTGLIEQCYHAGIAKNGIAYSNGGTIRDCYYLGKQGALNGTVSNISEKTFDELKVKETFAGFDFINTWTMEGEPTYPYPELRSTSHIPERQGTIAFAGGTGTATNPYLVSTPAQLNEIRYHRNANFRLTNDIDLTNDTAEAGSYYNNGLGWEPIDYFFGILDGDGCKIMGMNINRPLQDGVALIGSFSDGEIKNLGIENSSITGQNGTGAFAGGSTGTITNCTNKSNITSKSHSGGITGSNFGILQNCCNYGNIDSAYEAGGITGNNGGTIENCTNAGLAKADYDIYCAAGGIAGKNTGAINNSNNTGAVTSQGHTGGIAGENNANGKLYLCTNTGTLLDCKLSIGGIAGYNDEGQISYCINNAPMNGKGNLGGILGAGSDGSITFCINYKDITSQGGYNCGGIAGIYEGTISNCFNTGRITGNGSCHGGIAGGFGAFIVKDCFNIGEINGTSYYGGIIGETYGNPKIERCYNAGYVPGSYGIVGWLLSGSIANSYYLSWDGFISTQSKSLDQLKHSATYTGFDFDNVWEIHEGETLPVLRGLLFISATGLDFVNTDKTTSIGQTVTLDAKVLPDDATNRNIYWSSSDPSTAKVSREGIVTALSGGTATITATTEDGGYSGSCNISIYQHVSGVTLNKHSIDIIIGNTTTLSASISPSNATNKNVSWSSSDPSVAIVDENGTILAIRTGHADITVTTAENGKSDKCTVYVHNALMNIHFNSGEGSPIDDLQTPYNSLLVKPIDPIRNGYELSAWCKDPNCQVEWTFATDKATDDVTLYAKWMAKQYKVIFNLGDNRTAEETVYYDSLIAKPTDPSKIGYTFHEWYKESNFNTAWDFTKDKMPANDVILYAKWTINTYTVTFDAQNGGSVNSEWADYNTPIKKPDDPIRTGYSFNGWYKDKDCTQSWDFGSDRVNSNIALYAKWEAIKLSVKFDSLGGSYVPAQTVEFNMKVQIPSAPTRSGYAFLGWFEEPSCITEWNFATDNVTSDTTLYAKWQPLSAYLSGLKLTPGASITPEFYKSKYSYKILLDEDTGSVTLTPVRENDSAALSLNGLSGLSLIVDLKNGQTVTRRIQVTYGRITKTYTFTITRAKSTNNYLSGFTVTGADISPIFNKYQKEYRVELPEGTDRTTIFAYAEVPELAKIYYSGRTYILKNDQTKTITIMVRSQAGKDIPYTLTIHRAKSTNTNLSSIYSSSSKCRLATPFDTNNPVYTLTMPANMSSITIYSKAADKLSKVVTNVTINGITKATNRVILSKGQTATVEVTVTSQSGVTKVYRITVNRLIN